MPRDYEKFALEYNAKRAAPRERPGLAGAFKRGLIQWPGDVLGMTPAGRRPGPMSDPRAAIPTQTQADFTREMAVTNSGIPEPVTYTEAALERFGRSAPFTALTAPAGGLGAFATEASVLSGVGNAAKFVASEVGQDLVATFAEQAAQEYGFGGAGQFAAGVVAGSGVPSPRAATGAADASLASGRRGVRRVSGDIKEVFKPSDVAKFAKDYGYTYPQALAALEDLFGRIDIDPATGFRDVEGAIRAVREGRDAFSDSAVRPILPVLIGETGGQNYASLTRSLTRGTDFGPGFAAAVQGRASAVARDIDENFQSLLPNGSTEQFFDASRLERSRSKDALQPLWVGAGLDSDNLVSLRGAKRAASAHFVGNPTVERKAPPIVKEILDAYGDNVSLRTFQDVKSDLGLAAYEASRLGDAQTAQHLGDVLKALQDEVEAISERGRPEYAEAIRATKEHHRLYDGRSRFVAAMERGEYGRDLVGAVLRPHKDLGQKGEAEIAMRIAEASGEDAVGSLRRTFMLDLMESESGNPRTVKQIRDRLARGRRAYEVILGKDGIKKLEKITRKREIAQFMDFGSAAESRRTGSNVDSDNQMVGGIVDIPSGFTSPEIAAGVSLVRRTWRRLVRDRSDARGITQEMLLDDEAWERLVRIPTKPSEAVEYVSTMERLWARAKTRAKLRARARGATDLRSLYRANLSPTAVNLSEEDIGLMNREEQRNNPNTVVAPLEGVTNGGVR